MKCNECGCLMNYERFYDLADDFDGWRCICCGDIVDDVILSNRSKRKWQPATCPQSLYHVPHVELDLLNCNPAE